MLGVWKEGMKRFRKVEGGTWLSLRMKEETGELPAFWSVEKGPGLGAWVIACAQGVPVTMKANAKFVSTYWLQ